MKQILSLILIFCLMLGGCAPARTPAQIAASTLPVYEFTARLCQGTEISVTRLVTESVSCLHDYTLQVGQMQAIESAELVVINGAGLEDFLDDALHAAPNTADASAGIALICHGDDHGHDHDHGHPHAEDPHIWLSPTLAAQMAANICSSLCLRYPEHQDTFQENLKALQADLDALQAYGDAQLQALSCRELVTFHDGFAYFAESFGLTILEAVEEESGSEASAAELIRLIRLVESHALPAVFIETNGSNAAAQIIAAETGTKIFTLDMAMAGESYFDAMYRNINTIKEALG